MKINIIAAIARNNAIGYQNRLLYHIKADLKRFKELTTGNTIIMGRHTYESLPKGALPNRRNIVLSHTANQLEGCDVYASLEAALSSCGGDDEVFLIGGEAVYREGLAVADCLLLTEIDAVPNNADAFFPDFDRSEWVETARECFPTESDNPPYCFTELRKR